MTKLAYMTPVMSEEAFVADEYVAACTVWTVSCNLPGTAGAQEDQWGHVTHNKNDDGTGCGNAKNQWIEIDEKGNVSMVEGNTSGLGDLPCTLTDSGWNTTSYNNTNITQGTTIYWTTSTTSGGGRNGREPRTWHHVGSAQVSSTSNHS